MDAPKESERQEVNMLTKGISSHGKSDGLVEVGGTLENSNQPWLSKIRLTLGCLKGLLSCLT